MRSTIAVGERTFSRDPVAELRVAQAGEGGERRARERAVALQVVARHHRERRDLALAPAPQRLGHEPEHRLRRPVRLEVRRHGGVVLDELAGRVVEVVAALGDGQRDDPRLRRGELLEHRLGVVGRVQVLDERADRPRVARAVGVLDDQRVEAVLRRAGRRASSRRPRITPTPQMPQSSALPSFMRRSWYIAMCARWKPPTPKCTTPVVTSSREYCGLGTSSMPRVVPPRRRGTVVAVDRRLSLLVISATDRAR